MFLGLWSAQGHGALDCDNIASTWCRQGVCDPVFPQSWGCEGYVCVVTRAYVGIRPVKCCQLGGCFAADFKRRSESVAFGE